MITAAWKDSSNIEFVCASIGNPHGPVKNCSLVSDSSDGLAYSSIDSGCMNSDSGRLNSRGKAHGTISLENTSMRSKTDLLKIGNSIHKSESIRLYHCELCHIGFATAGSLKQHRESQHEGTSYYCDLCDHSSTTKENLKIHKKCIHNKVKFNCDTCEYSSSSRANLIRHIQDLHCNTVIKVKFPRCREILSDTKKPSTKGR